MNTKLLPEWMKPNTDKTKRTVPLKDETTNALRDIAFVLSMTKRVRQEILAGAPINRCWGLPAAR